MGAQYKQGVREDKARILDELAPITGYHSKHAIRLLCGQRAAALVDGDDLPPATPCGRLIMSAEIDEETRERLRVIRERLDTVVGVELAASIRAAHGERHAYVACARDLPEAREQLLEVCHHSPGLGEPRQLRHARGERVAADDGVDVERGALHPHLQRVRDVGGQVAQPQREAHASRPNRREHGGIARDGEVVAGHDVGVDGQGQRCSSNARGIVVVDGGVR